MRVRTRARRVTLAAVAIVLAPTFVVGGLGAAADAAAPDVTPASGGRGVPVVPGLTAFDPAEVGYEQSEVFLSGTAEAYEPAGAFGTDGQFKAKTFEPGDGLMPGKYSISIECWDVPPNTTGNRPRAASSSVWRARRPAIFTIAAEGSSPAGA